MDLHFIPRAQLVDRLNEGWSLVPGHEYSTADYAILMFKPDVPVVLPAKQIRKLAQDFAPVRRRWGNKSSGATSRNVARYRKMERA